MRHLGLGLLFCVVLALSPGATNAQEPTPEATPAAAVAETTTEATTEATTEGTTPAPALSADEEMAAKAANLVGADVAWMLTSSALVLMMTAPGLALFYGGLVRKKNILSVMMQCFFLMGMMSVVYAVYGYSLCFSGNAAGGFIGDGGYVMMNNVQPYWSTSLNASVVPMEGTIPRTVHMIFQMMFFIITPGLICGAFAERMKFSAMVVFSLLWGTIVYCPVAHWVWSGAGWCSEFNGDAPYKAFDFAGGTVVHITSGVSALVCAIMLGKRHGFGAEPMPPHNLTYTCIGAALLWVGWFGFNAGSALTAGASASNAFVTTHLAAAAGTIAWPVIEWIVRGKPSILGACSGAVAGLVCITPAAGSVTPVAAIILGLAAGVVCYFFCTTIKNAFGYDDSLDAFGVHGVGGTLGAILTGVFATRAVRGSAVGQEAGVGLGLLEGNMPQLINQLVAVGASIGYAVIVSIILLKIIDLTIGLRVSQADEVEGLDFTQHGEEGYLFI